MEVFASMQMVPVNVHPVSLDSTVSLVCSYCQTCQCSTWSFLPPSHIHLCALNHLVRNVNVTLSCFVSTDSHTFILKQFLFSIHLINTNKNLN